MGCGKCRKQKRKIAFDPNAGKGSVQKQIKNLATRGFTMVQSFALSMASRGLRNEKVEKPIKQLRVLSCFGNGVIKPCKNLKQSSIVGKFYCDACGCGDTEKTWLLVESDNYSKLDYPKLNCPLSMPGFTNYTTSSIDDTNDRKGIIERVTLETITNIPVSEPKIEE